MLRGKVNVCRQVRRRRWSERLVYKTRNLELHSSLDRQPMKLSQHRSDVLTAQNRSWKTLIFSSQHEHTPLGNPLLDVWSGRIKIAISYKDVVISIVYKIESKVCEYNAKINLRPSYPFVTISSDLGCPMAYSCSLSMGFWEYRMGKAIGTKFAIEIDMTNITEVKGAVIWVTWPPFENACLPKHGTTDDGGSDRPTTATTSYNLEEFYSYYEWQRVQPPA